MSTTRLPKLYFNTYNGKYDDNVPVFYKTEEIEVAQALKRNADVIRDELSVIWQKEGAVFIEKYGNYGAFDDKQFPPDSWKKLIFKVWDIKNKRMYQRFPVTASIIDRFPGVSSCFVTRLSPKSVIKAHGGETNANLRIHMGLEVKVNDPDICGIRVKEEKVAWKNGEVFTFLDAYNHEVWNHSEHDRYILIVDVIRPEFAHRKKFICSRVITSQFFNLLTNKTKLSFLYKLPGWIVTGVTGILHVPILMAVWLNNKTGFLKL